MRCYPSRTKKKSNTSDVESDGQFLDVSDDDHQDDLDRINEMIAEIEEAKLKKLKAEKARLEAKAASRSPTKKKPRATFQQKVPIARKKKLKGATPKQVTIEEGNNTLKSPPKPPTTARILEPELAAVEAQNNQPILQSVLEAIHPYFVKLQGSADKMSIAARQMEQEQEEARTRLAATNMGQEQPPPSGPTLHPRGRLSMKLQSRVIKRTVLKAMRKKFMGFLLPVSILIEQ
ncbi:unnamed protein product [Cylindrotheca closterium]|uniref:Uncharacterized protein n=1 Tax=Cylindrotheca closterium TaxID=2856 RepID=A0AAD2CI10_9STRA|nr:unnamed protein product [Cylindrotheca closterium]